MLRRRACRPGGFSKGEELLAWQLRHDRLPEPVRQYRFHKVRRWKFDFAWPSPDLMVAAEVEGITLWGRSLGWHQRPKRMEGDCEKYNTATLAGWKVLRFTPGMIQAGAALEVLRLALADADAAD